MHNLVSIAVPSPLRRHFDYIWPAELPAPRPGERVLVPFGQQRLVAVVLAEGGPGAVPDSALKTVIRRLDENQPALSEELLALGQWAADYYHHPIGECLHQILPVQLRKLTATKSAAVEVWQRSPDCGALSPPPARAHQQRALLRAFEQNHQLSKRQIKDMGFSAGVLAALIKGGYVRAGQKSIAEAPRGNAALTLNGEQQTAVDAVAAALGGFERFLLEGVTGSGKTEVYLQAIAQCLTQGRQALVLVPEIGLTPQTLARFEQRFPGQVVALHSGLTDMARYQNWRAAREGRCAIVLGTRSAVLTDFANLGLIIVDEEHDASYKQQEGWRYSARDLAVKRAAHWACPVLLGSATPSLDSLHNMRQGRYRPLQLRHRAGGAVPPELRLLDVRQASLQEGLSPQLLAEVKHCLHAGNQALVFLNRRGFAPVMQCHSCGWMAQCNACDARMTVHMQRRELRCHHCDARAPLPNQCPQCDNRSLFFKGPGTERLELALQKQFPDTPIIRIDRDTTSNKGSMEGLVHRIQQGEPAVLVGTQMLAKGHHFPAVTLVGIVDIDGGLFSADFRAAERCGQLLYQVAGRAGRGRKAGRVLIQTHCPEHPVLQQLLGGGYGGFAETLLAERALLNLPPYSFMAVLRAEANDPAVAEQFLQAIDRDLSAAGLGHGIVGPLPAPMARRAGRYRCSLLFQFQRRGELHRALDIACPSAESQRRLARLRWSVDVDPIELF